MNTIVCPPDNRRATVILNRAHYMNKINEILTDTTKLKLSPNDDHLLTAVLLEDRIDNDNEQD